MRAVLADGDRLAGQALEQETEGTRTLTDLERASPHSEEFDRLVERLEGQLRRHVAFEDAVFARLRQTLSQDDRERLGARIVEAWRAEDRERRQEDGGQEES